MDREFTFCRFGSTPTVRKIYRIPFFVRGIASPEFEKQFDDILTRQRNGRLVRNAIVRPEPKHPTRPASNHDLVYASTRLRGRRAPGR